MLSATRIFQPQCSRFTKNARKAPTPCSHWLRRMQVFTGHIPHGPTLSWNEAVGALRRRRAPVVFGRPIDRTKTSKGLTLAPCLFRMRFRPSVPAPGERGSRHRASAHAPNDSSILNETPFYFLTPFPPVSPRIRFIFLLFCQLSFLVCDSVTGWQRSSLSSGTTALLVFLFIRTTVFFFTQQKQQYGQVFGVSRVAPCCRRNIVYYKTSNLSKERLFLLVVYFSCLMFRFYACLDRVAVLRKRLIAAYKSEIKGWKSVGLPSNCFWRLHVMEVIYTLHTLTKSAASSRDNES